MRHAIGPLTAALLAFAGSASAEADEALVQPPVGAVLILEVVANGVQIYTCSTGTNGLAWAFKAPEAALVDRQGQPAGSHFGGPSWKSIDGSMVTGDLLAKANAPEASAIPWLLLRVKSHQGSGVLAPVAYIRRSATSGGIAPSTGCDSNHAGAEARVPYGATYQFYAETK
jgi:hypothetical protein